MDERERLQQELEFQITTCIQGDQQFIQELKRLLPENEWNDWKTRIPQLKSCGRIRMEFLREEKMYQKMMKEIRQSSMKIYLLDLYEKDLREKYSDEIRDLYAQCVVEAAPKTTNRKEYRRLMRDLKKMLRYSGDPELAGNIAKKWKSEFSRRPAFLDELRKAGF